MKRTCICILFFLLCRVTGAQTVSLEPGLVISSFLYRNSAGDKLENLKGTYKSCLGLGVKMPVSRTPWNVSLSASADKYGATRNDEVLRNYSEWDVMYMGLNLGVDYEFFRPPMQNVDIEGFSLFIKGIVGGDFFISGKQKLNSQVFDLSGVEEFDKPVLFLKGGIGVNYYLTRIYVASLQYTFGRSLLIGNYSGQETLNYLTNTISLGFSADLHYKRR